MVFGRVYSFPTGVFTLNRVRFLTVHPWQLNADVVTRELILLTSWWLGELQTNFSYYTKILLHPIITSSMTK